MISLVSRPSQTFTCDQFISELIVHECLHVSGYEANQDRNLTNQVWELIPKLCSYFESL